MTSQYKIFISYSQDSCEHKRAVLRLAEKMRTQGLDCKLDQYEDSPDEGWIQWMEQGITKSRYVLCICSPGYFTKINRDLRGSGKGVKWEGAIITQELYEAEGRNRKFIPVILGESNQRYIPRMLRPFTYYDVLTQDGYERLYRRLTKSPSVTKRVKSNVIGFPKRKGRPEFATSEPKAKSPGVNQLIIGSGNVQLGVVTGNVKLSSRARPSINVLPSPGSIGTNSLLKDAIKRRFDKLGEEREKRFGKRAYAVIYKNFKREFGIKDNEKWTAIWEWPEAAADQIISYLDTKYSNTLNGRIEGAVRSGTLIPARGHLFKREKELLELLDLEISSPQVKAALRKYFGVDSHTKLDRLKHWHWVVHLEKLVQERIEE